MPGVPPARYTYLGPAGTFTEAALRTLPVAAEAELLPHATVAAALDAVRAGEVDGAVVALENSIEGAVSATLDELATGEPLQVRCEVLLAIRFALLVRPGTELAAVATVAGHSHAQPQCKRWLAANLPQARWEAAASNADAARQVAAGAFDAALAGAFAAERYGLTVLAEPVNDVTHAITRFVLVTRPGPSPAPTGVDRTSLVVFIGDDHPGALLELLTEFAVRGVNLTRIESRPTGSARTVRPYRSAAKAPASAASKAPAATCRAASAFEAAASHLACGRFAASHRLHCGCACECPATVATAASSVPGRTSRAKRIASNTSQRTCSGSPVASSSRVAETAPSMEFSSATTAPSTSPARTASSAAATVACGSSSASAATGRVRSAASVKVPAGPR